MGSVFFVVGPVRGENLVGLAAEQEVEFLLEDAVELFAELLIEIGHHPAANLKPLVGSSVGPPGACMTPSMETWAPTIIFRMGQLSLFEPRTNGLLPIRHVPTLKRLGERCGVHRM